MSAPCSRFPIVRRTQRRHHPPMARAQPSAPDLFPSPGREPSSSSPAESSETEAPFWRHVLPKNLDAAIRQLSDQELDRLVSAALGERARRKKPPVPESHRKRHAEAVAVSLPPGKLNAVRGAFKAGVTPSRIAKEFGLSRSDVQSALRGSDVKK
jgi:hypothetical protein